MREIILDENDKEILKEASAILNSVAERMLWTEELVDYQFIGCCAEELRDSATELFNMGMKESIRIYDAGNYEEE